MFVFYFLFCVRNQNNDTYTDPSSVYFVRFERGYLRSRAPTWSQSRSTRGLSIAKSDYSLPYDSMASTAHVGKSALAMFCVACNFKQSTAKKYLQCNGLVDQWFVHISRRPMKRAASTEASVFVASFRDPIWLERPKW